MRFPLLFALLPAAFAQPATELEAVVTTALGVFRIEFAPDKAPKHVDAFITRARNGFYDGSAFHRAVANGIIQGGDPLLKNPKTPKSLWGTGGLNLLPGNYSDMKHQRAVVSTVRIPSKPNSDGAQFFICVSAQPPLDGQFSAFGRVNEGMDVVEKISRVPTSDNGFTITPVPIHKIAIEPKKLEPFLNTPIDQLRRTIKLNTTLGTIEITLEPDWAPNHVRAFLKLHETGWYAGTAFHRIVKDFVVQGGMGHTRANGATHNADRWVRNLKGEFREDVKHLRGTLSMAHGDDPDSATTSFFLLLGPAPHLDGKYTAFGRITNGLEVLAAFEQEELDGESPKRPLAILP